MGCQIMKPFSIELSLEKLINVNLREKVMHVTERCQKLSEEAVGLKTAIAEGFIIIFVFFFFRNSHHRIIGVNVLQ